MAQPTIKQWISAFQLLEDAAQFLKQETKDILANNPDIINEDSEMAFGELADDSDEMDCAYHIIDSLIRFMDDDYNQETNQFDIQKDSQGHSLSDYIEILDKTKNRERFEPYDSDDSRIEDFSFAITMIPLTGIIPR